MELDGAPYDPVGFVSRVSGVESPAIPAELVAWATERELDPAELVLGHELARWLPAPHDELRLGLLWWVAQLRLANARGSTRVRVGEDAAEVMAPWLEQSRALASLLATEPAALQPVVGPAETGAGSDLMRGTVVRSSLVHAEGWLSTRAHHALEREVAERVRGLVAKGPRDPAAVTAAMAEVLAHPSVSPRGPIELSDEQVAAVRRAARSRLALISGGPGTGKTSIVVSLLRVLVRLGITVDEIALAAPTGKAADRMRSAVSGALAALPQGVGSDAALLATRIEATTLHRLLVYAPSTRSFRHHERNPLAARVVIVDEGSMIDLPMFAQLLRALGEGTSLVLLGDADQLPSVDVGAVMRDLVAALPAVRARLTRSYRMDPRDPAGRAVLLAANAVRDGSVDELQTHARARDPAGLEFAGCEQVRAGGREGLLRRWAERELASSARVGHAFRFGEGGFHPRAAQTLREELARSARARLLCATRSRPEGVHATNEWLRLRHRRAHGLPEHWRWAPGDPIIVTRNDYARGLYNGDTGMIMRARFASRRGGEVALAALFRRDDELVAYPVEALAGRLELAYATTVHKAQGSEYDRVAILLPAEPLPIVGRELLYTALTRARRSAIIVADAPVLHAACARRDERAGALGDLLIS